MKIRRLSNIPNRIVILLAIIGMVGASYVASAQQGFSIPSPQRVRMDFNGDRLPDFVFADPNTNDWMIQSQDGNIYHATIGSDGDRPVPADYDGDSIEDVAVVTVKGGRLIWRIQDSSSGKEMEIYWGLDSDTLVQGDYDGDGLADPAVWRSREGAWYILSSRTGEAITQIWGEPTDLAMPGDYDGDGSFDLCVFRPKTSSFFYFTSSSGIINEQLFGPFVRTGYERFVLADYDGDNITDFATYDPTKGGMFVIRQSTSGKYLTVSLTGSSSLCKQSSADGCDVVDFPVMADYDNDGMVDPAVWDSINARVIAMGSSQGYLEFSVKSSSKMISVSSFFITK